MFKSTESTLALGLLVALLASSASCQQQPSGPDQSSSSSAGVTPRPVVGLSSEQGKDKLNVHVPFVFDMERKGGKEGGLLDLSVLQGLVTVTRDKERDDKGPVKVTVMGVPVYQNSGVRSANEGVRGANEVNANLRESVQKLNEQMLGSMSNFLEQLSSSLRRSASATGGTTTERAKADLNRAASPIENTVPAN